MMKLAVLVVCAIMVSQTFSRSLDTPVDCDSYFSDVIQGNFKLKFSLNEIKKN